MAVSPANIKLIAPEFSTKSDSEINQFIALAELQVNRAILCTKADLIVMYLTAHMMSKASAGSATAVTSTKVGDLQRSYGSASGDINSTSYGQEYERLMRGISLSPIVAFQ